MTSRPRSTARRYRGRRLLRTLIVPLAGLFAIAAIAIPLAVQAGIEEEVGSGTPDSVPHAQPAGGPAPSEVALSTEVTETGAVRFGQFPLDLGWSEIYGRNYIDGPGPSAGGISMPEGHCHEEVLFGSGYRDKLSTYVGTDDVSRTREILGYASADAARSAFRALGDAVASCPAFGDPNAGDVVNAAEVYESIDEANARSGMTTFTFAYTSTGSAPFGGLYQFATVDDVLYGSNDYGEWTTETARQGASALNEENASLISLLSRIKR
ncbi:hypothetical protein [Nocardioides sp.]|uniref:hypothetical protein n=1 Tax=Nocardioides sp. TaxID=35761 RepID=UPI003D0EF0CD